MKKRVLAFVLLLSLVTFAGCFKKPAEEIKKDPYTEKKEEVKKIVEEKATNDAVEEILGKMTLEEKVYQMLFVQPEDITKVGEVYSAGDATKEAIKLVWFMSVSNFSITYSIFIYLFLFLGIISLVMVFKREDKKGLHDLLASTKVVEE